MLTLIIFYGATIQAYAQTTQLKAHYGLELSTTNNVLAFDVRVGPSIQLQSGSISGDIKQFYSYRFARAKEIVDFHLRVEAGGSYNFKEKDMVLNVGAALRTIYNINSGSKVYCSLGFDKNEFGGVDQYKLSALAEFAMIRVGYTYILTDEKHIDQFLNFEAQQHFWR